MRTLELTAANAERAAKAIQDKLDRLDEPFLFERSIDIHNSSSRRNRVDGNRFVRTRVTAPFQLLAENRNQD